ncbi:MAG: hypothetical protein MUW56_18740 [Chryseobacterium sp.]|uniref:hypothetical protein n=1 Tax=Chryseobacterium sp. TaxID=1871047 RepID=UPI0025C50B3C|nr:hypothetical protein [Chryseobacterium sp.]MCJ7935601.1 hypothetical protein [Chryseobacterium sp.]
MDCQIIQGSIKNKEELESKLSILAPSKFLNSNSILDFERFKKVDVDWLDVLNIDKNNVDIINSNFKTSIQLIQEYFFKYWSYKKYYPLLNTEKNNFNETLQLSDTDIKNKYWMLAEIGYLSNKKQNVLYSTPDVFCIIHHESERLYYFSNKKYDYFTKTDFEKIFEITDLETLSIQEFWSELDQHDLQLNVNICFKKSTDNTFNEKYFFPKNSSIDRSLIFLREEFFRLDNELIFLTKLKNVYEANTIDATTKNEIPNSSKLDDIAANFSNTLDQEQLNIAKQSYFEICNRFFEIKNRIENINQDFKNIGYFICTENTKEIYTANGKNVTQDVLQKYNLTSIAKGDIFRLIEKSFTYSYTYPYQESVCDLRIPLSPFGGNVCVKSHNETRYGVGYQTEILPVPVKVDLLDPLESYKIQLQSDVKDIHFFTFIKTFEGYVSEHDGTFMSQILKQCEEDESFRLNCVIITYEYDFILTEKKYPVDAKIFFAPLPVLFSQDLPDLSIRETLAYRIAWEGAELGQLVNSVNLAPGESRQISLSTSFTQNTTKSSSLKNTSDLNTSNSFDLSTELQNEATKEISKTDSFSANVSGSYGGVVSGGASGSTTSTVKTFTRDMSKLARKTSASINRRLVSEVNESSSQSITVNQSSSRTSNISNINQGSTLNLMIYQINNRFKSGLFLDELQMSITKTTELIPNSGLYEAKYYNFHNLELYIENIIESINPLLIEEVCCCEKAEISERLAKIINDLIHEEYAEESNVISIEPVDHTQLKKIDNDDKIKDIFKEKRANLIYNNKKSKYYNPEKYKKEKDKLDENKSILDESKSIFYNNTKEYSNTLKTKSLINKNLFELEELKQESYFTINSGAFYIDSLVGINPATEPYSDDMRNLEKERVKDKNNEQKIKNLLLQNELPYITKISSDKEKNRSIIHLSVKLKCKCFLPVFCNCSKHFKVYVDDHLVSCNIKLSKDKYYVIIHWDNEVPCLQELEQKLEIVCKNLVIKYLH